MSNNITINLNGETITLGQQVASLLEFLLSRNITPETRGIAVTVNGTLVPRIQWTGTTLRNGDEIVIIGATQGG